MSIQLVTFSNSAKSANNFNSLGTAELLIVGPPGVAHYIENGIYSIEKGWQELDLMYCFQSVL